MTDLLLVFAAAALLNELLLRRFYDRAIAATRTTYRGITTMAVLVLVSSVALHVVPVPGLADASRNFPQVLMIVILGFVLGLRRLPVDSALASAVELRVRAWLPLLVGNAAVLCFAALDQRRVHGLVQTLGFAMSTSVALIVLVTLVPAVRDRLERTAAPDILSGTPIVALTALVVACAASGLAGALPW